MRIGLSGPLLAPKRELIEDIKDSFKFANYNFDETAQYVQDTGLQTQVYNLFMNSHVVSTCSTFDSIVYSKYLLDNNIIDEDEYVEVGKAWLQTAELYNVVFYLPPNETEEEGMSESQCTLWSLFDRAIFKYEVPVINLSGTREERKAQFLRVFL